MADNENIKADPSDRVAVIRGLVPIDASSLPHVPKQFQPLTADDQSSLRKVARENEAEIQQALSQIAGRGAELRSDLGKNAPDPARAATIVERLKANRAAKTKLAALLSYVEDSTAVALHDAALLVQEVHQLLTPNVKKDSSLEENYSDVLEYTDLIGQKISEGRARKRKEKK